METVTGFPGFNGLKRIRLCIFSCLSIYYVENPVNPVNRINPVYYFLYHLSTKRKAVGGIPAASRHIKEDVKREYNVTKTSIYYFS